MKPADFELLSGLVKQRSGLILSKEKLYLLESRLIPLARKRGMTGLDELATAIRGRRDEPLITAVTEAMTTNESSFFRDLKPFENFRNVVLPRLIEARMAKRSLRIWCAACSTGQEPYSIAIFLREEARKLAGWRVDIVATDLSTEVIEKAKLGMYSQFEVQRGMPVQLLMKYFAQTNEMWQIDASVRAMVKFQPLNLLQEFSALGSFDVVFCRNVLIYFDNPTKRSVLERISRQMPSDGMLFLGGAETVLGVTDAFKPAQGLRGVYQLTRRTAH
ncbi:MAG: CheR family methyltransferase [Alphaproteobacteria bacterium]